MVFPLSTPTLLCISSLDSAATTESAYSRYLYNSRSIYWIFPNAPTVEKCGELYILFYYYCFFFVIIKYYWLRNDCVGKENEAGTNQFSAVVKKIVHAAAKIFFNLVSFNLGLRVYKTPSLLYRWRRRVAMSHNVTWSSSLESSMKNSELLSDSDGAFILFYFLIAPLRNNTLGICKIVYIDERHAPGI